MAEERRSERFRPLRSFTRLLIGGILLGSELLENRLREWEGNGKTADPEHSEDDVLQKSGENPLPETLPAPYVRRSQQNNIANMRYALIGLIFEGEDKLDEALSAAQQISRRVNTVIDPIYRPVQKIRKLGPVQKNFDQLTRRGQTTLDRWVYRGREEENISRQLTQTAATSTLDQSIEYMADNEAIAGLIQSQSLSLAEQLLKLVRAISVSADYYFEGLVRYILRRPPRYLLPLPSREVQKQSTWTLQDIRNEDL